MSFCSFSLWHLFQGITVCKTIVVNYFKATFIKAYLLKNDMIRLIAVLLSLLFSSKVTYGMAIYDAFAPLEGILVALFRLVSLSWIPAEQHGNAVKFVIFLVVLVLLTEVLKKPFPDNAKVRGVIAFSFSAISVIFLPTNVETMIGTQVGLIVAFLFLNFFIGVFLFVAWGFIKNLEDGRLKKISQFIWWLFGFIAISSSALYLGIDLTNSANSADGTGFVAIALTWLLMIFPIGMLWAFGGLVISLFSGVSPGDVRSGASSGWGGAGSVGSGVWNSFKRGFSTIGSGFSKVNSAWKERGGGPEARALKKKHTLISTKIKQIENLIKKIERRELKTLNDISKDLEKIKNLLDEKKSLEDKKNSLDSLKVSLFKNYTQAEDYFVKTTKSFQALIDEANELKRLLEQDGITLNAEKEKMLDEFAMALRLLKSIKEMFIEFKKETIQFIEDKHLDIHYYKEEVNKINECLKKIKVATEEFINKESRLEGIVDENIDRSNIMIKTAEAKGELDTALQNINRSSEEIYDTQNEVTLIKGLHDVITNIESAQKQSFNNGILEDVEVEIKSFENIKKNLSDINEATLNPTVLISVYKEKSSSIENALRKVYEVYTHKMKELKTTTHKEVPIAEEYDLLVTQRDALKKYQRALDVIVKEGNYNKDTVKELTESSVLVLDVTQSLINELKLHYTAEKLKIDLEPVLKKITSLSKRCKQFSKDLNKVSVDSASPKTKLKILSLQKSVQKSISLISEIEKEIKKFNDNLHSKSPESINPQDIQKFLLNTNALDESLKTDRSILREIKKEIDAQP